MRRALAVVVALILVMLACLPSAAAAPAGRTQALRVSWSGTEPASLDSVMAVDDPALFVLTQTMEGLVRFDANGAIRKGSGAAQDWKVSDDGLTYTFTLKEGLTWSDGAPLTSRDFAYAWLRALDPKTEADYSYQLIEIKGAWNWDGKNKEDVGIRTPDDRTLVVTLEMPAPWFLRLLTVPIFFPQRADLDGKVFNGPFMVSSWNKGQGIELVRNKRYWEAAHVPLDQVNIAFSTDGAEAIRQYDAGKADLVRLPYAMAAQVKGRTDYRADGEGTVWYLSVNCDRPALGSAYVRRALSLAIDKQKLADTGWNGSAVAATGLVPDGIHLGGVLYRQAVGEMQPTGADVATAREELARGLRALGLDTLPELELIVGTGGSHPTAASLIKAMLEENLPGVSIRVSAVDFKTRLERARTGNFDLMLAGWGTDFDDPSNTMELWLSDSSFNDSNWSHYGYDSRVRGAGRRGTKMDQVHRLVAYAEAERIILDEAPVIPLLSVTATSLQRPYVQGLIPLVPGGGFDLKYAWIVP